MLIMTKRQKREISTFIAGVFAITWFILMFVVYESTNIYLIIGLVIGTVILEEIVFAILPNKKTKKKVTRSKESKKKTESNVPHNRLRSDDEIIASKLDDLSWR